MTPRSGPAHAGRIPVPLPLALLGLAWLALVFPVPAVAATATTDPTYDWRPGWVPGDPEEPRFDLFTAPWASTSLVSPGVFVTLDPVTRLPIRPSAEQRRALSAALVRGNGGLTRSDIPLPTERLRDGGELVHLPENFQVFLVARRNAQGGFTIDCTTDPRGGNPTGPQPTAAPVQPREAR